VCIRVASRRLGRFRYARDGGRADGRKAEGGERMCVRACVCVSVCASPLREREGEAEAEIEYSQKVSALCSKCPRAISKALKGLKYVQTDKQTDRHTKIYVHRHRHTHTQTQTQTQTQTHTQTHTHTHK